MNAETKKQVEQIIKQGYYRQFQTFGEGGWGHFAKLTTHDWKSYVLWGITEEEPSWNEIEKITAKDDETVIAAFKSLYHLDMFIEWDIQERIVEYRLVDASEAYTSDKG